MTVGSGGCTIKESNEILKNNTATLITGTTTYAQLHTSSASIYIRTANNYEETNGLGIEFKNSSNELTCINSTSMVDTNYANVEIRDYYINPSLGGKINAFPTMKVGGKYILYVNSKYATSAIYAGEPYSGFVNIEITDISIGIATFSISSITANLRLISRDAYGPNTLFDCRVLSCIPI